MLSTSWVRLNGPALKFVLLWKGTLTRSANRVLRFFGQVFVFGGITPGAGRRERVGKPAFEFVVRTELNHLKVAVQLDGWGRGGSPVFEENLIVFEFYRPVRFEAVLDAHSG